MVTLALVADEVSERVFHALYLTYLDPVFPILVLANQDLCFPGYLRGAIEDDQIALVGTDPVHIIGGLCQALLYRCFQGFVQDFDLDDRPLYRAMEALTLVQGPLYQQIGATRLQPGLSVDAPTAVDDALQERLHQ